MAYPVLARRDTWYTQGNSGISRGTITDVHIKDSYSPTGTATAQWDASAAQDGSITAYIEGTKLTIAGNGSGKIKLNPDSAYLFHDANHVRNESFSNALTISGLDVFDASDVTLFVNAFTYAKFQTIRITNWVCPLCTDFRSMFSDCLAKTIDLSGLDFSGCITAHHMFSNCYDLTSLKISNLNSSNCKNLGALFNDCSSLETIDISGLNTSRCLAFGQMFERCISLKKIIGIENIDTSSAGTGVMADYENQAPFAEMFSGCSSLKKLNLSNVDTSHVYDLAGNAMHTMFDGMTSLEEITLGANFSRNGTTTHPANPEKVPVLPTPTITGADGNWHTANRTAYAPDAIPDNTAATYYATTALADASENLILSGTLSDIGDAIRDKNNTLAKINPVDMPKKIRDIETGTDTTDATATAADIMHNTTAYIANGKTTGTFSLDTEISDQDAKIAAIKDALIGKGAGSGTSPVIEAKTITENGTYTAPVGVDGFNPIEVNVAGSGSIETCNVKVISEGEIDSVFSVFFVNALGQIEYITTGGSMPIGAEKSFEVLKNSIIVPADKIVSSSYDGWEINSLSGGITPLYRRYEGCYNNLNSIDVTGFFVTSNCEIRIGLDWIIP